MTRWQISALQIVTSILLVAGVTIPTLKSSESESKAFHRKHFSPGVTHGKHDFQSSKKIAEGNYHITNRNIRNIANNNYDKITELNKERKGTSDHDRVIRSSRNFNFLDKKVISFEGKDENVLTTETPIQWFIFTSEGMEMPTMPPRLDKNYSPNISAPRGRDVSKGYRKSITSVNTSGLLPRNSQSKSFKEMSSHFNDRLINNNSNYSEKGKNSRNISALNKDKTTGTINNITILSIVGDPNNTSMDYALQLELLKGIHSYLHNDESTESNKNTHHVFTDSLNDTENTPSESSKWFELVVWKRENETQATRKNSKPLKFSSEDALINPISDKDAPIILQRPEVYLKMNKTILEMPVEDSMEKDTPKMTLSPQRVLASNTKTASSPKISTFSVIAEGNSIQTSTAISNPGIIINIQKYPYQKDISLLLKDDGKLDKVSMLSKPFTQVTTQLSATVSSININQNRLTVNMLPSVLKNRKDNVVTTHSFIYNNEILPSQNTDKDKDYLDSAFTTSTTRRGASISLSLYSSSLTTNELFPSTIRLSKYAHYIDNTMFLLPTKVISLFSSKTKVLPISVLYPTKYISSTAFEIDRIDKIHVPSFSYPYSSKKVVPITPDVTIFSSTTSTRSVADKTMKYSTSFIDSYPVNIQLTPVLPIGSDLTTFHTFYMNTNDANYGTEINDHLNSVTRIQIKHFSQTNFPNQTNQSTSYYNGNKTNAPLLENDSVSTYQSSGESGSNGGMLTKLNSEENITKEMSNKLHHMLSQFITEELTSNEENGTTNTTFSSMFRDLVACALKLPEIVGKWANYLLTSRGDNGNTTYGLSSTLEKLETPKLSALKNHFSNILKTKDVKKLVYFPDRSDIQKVGLLSNLNLDSTKKVDEMTDDSLNSLRNSIILLLSSLDKNKITSKTFPQEIKSSNNLRNPNAINDIGDHIFTRNPDIYVTHEHNHRVQITNVPSVDAQRHLLLSPISYHYPIKLESRVFKQPDNYMPLKEEQILSDFQKNRIAVPQGPTTIPLLDVLSHFNEENKERLIISPNWLHPSYDALNDREKATFTIPLPIAVRGNTAEISGNRKPYSSFPTYPATNSENKVKIHTFSIYSPVLTFFSDGKWTDRSEMIEENKWQSHWMPHRRRSTFNYLLPSDDKVHLQILPTTTFTVSNAIIQTKSHKLFSDLLKTITELTSKIKISAWLNSRPNDYTVSLAPSIPLKRNFITLTSKTDLNPKPEIGSYNELKILMLKNMLAMLSDKPLSASRNSQ